MLSLQICSQESIDLIPKEDSAVKIFTDDSHVAFAKGLIESWKNSSNEEFYLLGMVVGIRRADGLLTRPIFDKDEKSIFEDFNRVSEVEGRFIVIKKCNKDSVEIWTDNYSRVDIYWEISDKKLYVATSLDLLPVGVAGSPPDNLGVAHSIMIYGFRPPKKHTLYSSVKRLGVNEKLRIFSNSIAIEHKEFKLLSTKPEYRPEMLNKYADKFIEAIRSRASKDGNIVYLSSGWDSTSILAVLVHIFGNRKVRAVIGRMRYSERSGVINQFEVSRAKLVAEYYGVKLDIAEFDYRSDAEAMLQNVGPLLKSQQFSILTGLNHYLLAKKASETSSNSGEVIFAGEMSDGAHNLGFSQFATIFHPASFEYREYSDKMASYLFGPTFLGELSTDRYTQDPIWQIFKARAGNTIFDDLRNDRGQKVSQLLASFFLRPGRLPLYSINNTSLLTDMGKISYAKDAEEIYLSKLSKTVNQENIYSAYLHLYNSFHWQGSTVATLEHTANLFGMHCVLPFNDSEIIRFLSEMPESWGRGLDFNPTKYPLKWMLKNRVDYPFHLQTGPHAYTYDVNPEFSLVGEVLNSSSFTSHFKKAISNRKFIDWMDGDYFNKQYIDSVSNKYLKSEHLSKVEYADLTSIAMHSLIGVYS